MTKGNTHVALRRRIRQVTLHAAGHQRRRQRIQQRVRHLQVGLRVLETDRVDLVRHRRRTRRPLRRQVLVEVIHRNVRPCVRRQVVGDAARARHIRVQLGLPVMRLDLRGQRIPCQAQAFHERAGQRRPIRARHRHDVRGPRARRTVDLAQILRGLDARDLAGQAVREHRHLLADRHRRRRLAMRVRQHRDGRPGLS